jgi:curved DNA-binding protein CbpA
MSYFDDCKTNDEAKTRYHKLVMEHHPDKGGNADTFKKIRKEYENWKLNQKHYKTNSSYTYEDLKNAYKDDPIDPFGFKQNKTYGGPNQYADIRFNHPIFNELNQYRQWVAYYKGQAAEWERIYIDLKMESHQYFPKINDLENKVYALQEELRKKKANMTRLKNKLKKMQGESLKKKK